jgi:hypothetical protein
MQKLDNSIAHDPDNGAWGDCHRVCFAMILGLNVEDVPHFFVEGPAGDRAIQQQRVKDFLASYSLVEASIAYPVEDYSLILATMGSLSPGVTFILGGMSAAGCGHSVVCLDGEVFHDPTGTGIVAPMDDGYYWVTLFSPAPGTHPERRTPCS